MDNLEKNELYVLGKKSDGGEHVFVYNTKGEFIGEHDDGRAYAVSNNGQIIACRSGSAISFHSKAAGP